ncbi:MAG: D-glycerate dehydrogenase, partial [Candidatus Hydrogenedentales bacterium]
MSARVFVTRRLAESALRILYDAVGQDAVAVHPHDRVIQRDELLAGVRGVEAILSILTERIDAEVMDAAGPQLRVVANYAVGYDNIDVAAATQRRVAVTNTPDVLTESTADLTWALILGAARRVGEGERFLRAGEW